MARKTFLHIRGGGGGPLTHKLGVATIFTPFWGQTVHTRGGGQTFSVGGCGCDDILMVRKRRMWAK